MRNAIMVLIVILASGGLALADDPNQRRTLSELPGVQVVVENLPDAARDLQITEGSLTNDIAERLHQIGVKTLTEAEWKEQPTAPALYIAVAATSATGIDRAFAVDLQVRQRVKTNSGVIVHAMTWDAPVTVSVSIDSRSQASLQLSARTMLLQLLSNQINQFGAAWRDSHAP